MLARIHCWSIPIFSIVEIEINTACSSHIPSWSKSTETKALPSGGIESATILSGRESAIAGKTIPTPNNKAIPAIPNIDETTLLIFLYRKIFWLK